MLVSVLLEGSLRVRQQAEVGGSPAGTVDHLAPAVLQLVQPAVKVSGRRRSMLVVHLLRYLEGLRRAVNSRVPSKIVVESRFEGILDSDTAAVAAARESRGRSEAADSHWLVRETRSAELELPALLLTLPEFLVLVAVRLRCVFLAALVSPG